LLFSIGSKMIFAHCVILRGVNLFNETTMGTFANIKSIYDVMGKRSIKSISSSFPKTLELVINGHIFLMKSSYIITITFKHLRIFQHKHRMIEKPTKSNTNIGGTFLDIL